MRPFAYRSTSFVGAVLAATLGLQHSQAGAQSLDQGLPATKEQNVAVQATPSATPLVARYVNVPALLQSFYLPPWPPDGSDAARVDLTGVLAAQEARAAADISEAQIDAVRSPVAWAQDTKALGPGFTQECFPLTTALLLELHGDMRLVNRATNAQWGNRPRPSLLGAMVTPSLPAENANSPSYPSARAAASRLWALVLADIFPHARERLMSMAQRSAQLRLIAGVHFPSDLTAGILVGEAAYAWLQRNSDFKQSLSAAKSESTSLPQCSLSQLFSKE